MEITVVCKCGHQFKLDISNCSIAGNIVTVNCLHCEELMSGKVRNMDLEEKKKKKEWQRKIDITGDGIVWKKGNTGTELA